MNGKISAVVSDSGTIERGKTYSLSKFLELTGLAGTAFRKAKKAGLRVRYIHHRGFVRGDDWLDYLESQLNDEYKQTKPEELAIA